MITDLKELINNMVQQFPNKSTESLQNDVLEEFITIHPIDDDIILQLLQTITLYWINQAQTNRSDNLLLSTRIHLADTIKLMRDDESKIKRKQELISSQKQHFNESMLFYMGILGALIFISSMIVISHLDEFYFLSEYFSISLIIAAALLSSVLGPLVQIMHPFTHQLNQNERELEKIQRCNTLINEIFHIAPELRPIEYQVALFKQNTSENHNFSRYIPAA